MGQRQCVSLCVYTCLCDCECVCICLSGLQKNRLQLTEHILSIRKLQERQTDREEEGEGERGNETLISYDVVRKQERETKRRWAGIKEGV